jgi:hypothetical protein
LLKQGEFMKRQLAIALGLAVVSGSALASKARLEALGQDANGSMVIDDHRSIFLNAAHLNHHKDFATFEFGSPTQNEDARTTPRSEGGVFMSSGNMVYGLYFGEESNSTNNRASLGGTGGIPASTMQAEGNNTTIFFAGDAGVQWGASLLFGSYDDGADSKASQTRARFGVVSGNIDAFLNMGLSNTAEDGTWEWEGKSALDLGVTYNQGDVNYMLRYQANEVDATISSTTTTTKTGYTAIGASKEYKLNDKAMMWASAWYAMSSSEVGDADETKDTALPVTLALETSATDWLKLRASVSQRVLINEEDDGTDKSTKADTTTTAFGASFNYGDLTIDAMVGGTNEDTSTTGEFGSDDMLHRVSMTYNF